METKQKQTLMIGAGYKPVSEPGSQSRSFLGVRIKATIAVWMSLSQLAISLGDQVNFLSGSYSNRHEVYLNISCCANFSDLCIKLSSFTMQDFRKMAMLLLSDSSQKNGRGSRSRWQRYITWSLLSSHRDIKRMGEIGNFSKKVAARYGWTLEKFRIQPSLQVNNKTSRKRNTTRT